MRRFVIASAVVALLAGCGGRSQPRDVDVSQAAHPQDEVAAAIDPRDPKILVAGSNSWDERQMRAYTSTDGGRTWKSERAPTNPTVVPPPQYPPADPAVAIDLRGRQYYAFVASAGYAARVFLAWRPDAGAKWQTVQTPLADVTTGPPYASDDKDAIAVDLSAHRNRVYVAWSRSLFAPPARDPQRTSIVIVHSDTGGATWSAPATVVSAAPRARHGFGASIAIGRDGTVYVTWATLSGDIFIARAADGTRFHRPRLVATRPGCRRFRADLSRVRIVGAQAYPYAAVDDERHHVLVVWNDADCNGSSRVWLTTFDASLRRRLTERRVDAHGGIQGLPALTVDRDTNDAWVCWYDTGSDRSGRRAHYTCAVSRDGGATFERPQRAASAATDEMQPQAGKHAYGDYEAVVAAGGIAHPFWTDSRDLATRGEEIYTTTLRRR